MQSAADAVTAAESLGYILVRLTTFTALVVVVGVVLFSAIVVPRLDRLGPPDLGARVRDELRPLAFGASVALLALALTRLSLQQAMLTAAFGDEVPVPLADVVRGSWGVGLALQVVAGAAGVAAFRLRLPAPVLRALAWLTLVGAVSPALSGHAAGEEQPLVPILADVVHVLAAGAWVGMLLAMAAVALPAVRQRPQALQAGGVAAMLAAFSPVALGSAALLALTGGYAAWLHVGSIPALWTTRYGLALAWKLALVAAMLAAGAINWRRLGPGAESAEGARRLERSAWIELGIALLILAVTAVLVARETPTDLSG